MAAKKTRTQKTPSKADFVRAHRDSSPKEIVEDARAAGIKLDVGYVYNVRAADKSARKKRRAAKKASTPATAAANVTPSSNANASRLSASAATNEEELLKLVAAEVGLGRAMEILAGERARVQAVLRG